MNFMRSKQEIESFFDQDINKFLYLRSKVAIISFNKICSEGRNFNHEIKSLKFIISNFQFHEQFVSRKCYHEINSI
jgi:hypothetical protein